MKCEGGLVSILTKCELTWQKVERRNYKFCLLTIYGQWVALVLGPLDKP